MSAHEPVRVLVVDDSALMRKLIGDMLRASPGIHVVGTARDADEALELAGKLKPDVVTLDVQMPGKSGLEIIRALLADHHARIIMVSSLTQEGASVTLEALELGAFDFLPKPGPNKIADLKASGELLVSKVLAAAQSRVQVDVAAHAGPAAAITVPAPATPVACIAIGISTGGPQALSETLPKLTAPTPPILIVQHMPAHFTYVFAERLRRHCSVELKEAAEGDRVLPDRILIAPGGRHMTLIGRPPQVRVALTEGPLVSGHRPSIDMLFQSAVRTYGPAVAGIIMTGMGRDGVEGCKRIRAAGGLTLGQDEASSVIYGMNKVAFLEDCLCGQFSLHELPGIVRRMSRPV